jgi:hypothetical protein
MVSDPYVAVSTTQPNEAIQPLRNEKCKRELIMRRLTVSLLTVPSYRASQITTTKNRSQRPHEWCSELSAQSPLARTVLLGGGALTEVLSDETTSDLFILFKKDELGCNLLIFELLVYEVFKFQTFNNFKRKSRHKQAKLRLPCSYTTMFQSLQHDTCTCELVVHRLRVFSDRGTLPLHNAKSIADQEDATMLPQLRNAHVYPTCTGGLTQKRTADANYMFIKECLNSDDWN